MVTNDQIYVGNIFINTTENRHVLRWVIVEIKDDNGTLFITIEDEKQKRHKMSKELFGHMLIKEEDWRLRPKRKQHIKRSAEVIANGK